ncbi:MAG: type 1 periplasmic binding fold superfamily protein [Saprospiraceae bacterium]|nr:type 1 periplasmic binding fold superfamily protein [Saprospiraceae bacterium]
MKLRSLMFSLLVGLLFIGFTSCNDDPEEEPEEELITNMNLIFTPISGGDALTFTFEDLDGQDGGNAPIITGATLTASTSYSVFIELFNEAETPTKNIGDEVAEEADEHQFFFQVSGSLNLSVAYSDTDNQGNPIGIETLMTTGDPSSGTLNVTLRHEPNKNAENVSAGDISNAGGSTDIEADFDVRIE